MMVMVIPMANGHEREHRVICFYSWRSNKYHIVMNDQFRIKTIQFKISACNKNLTKLDSLLSEFVGSFKTMHHQLSKKNHQ